MRRKEVALGAAIGSGLMAVPYSDAIRWRNRVQHDDQNIAKHATAHGRGALHVRIANVDARLLYLGPIQPVRP